MSHPSVNNVQALEKNFNCSNYCPLITLFFCDRLREIISEAMAGISANVTSSSIDVKGIAMLTLTEWRLRPNWTNTAAIFARTTQPVDVKY